MNSPSSDEREILSGLNRFARILDTRQWDSVAEVFADDLAFNYGDGREQSGIGALRQQFRQFLDVCGPSQHLLGSIVITVDGDTGISRAYVQARHQGAGTRSHLFFDSNGEYIDRWERRPEGWRVVRRDVNWLMHMGDPSVLQFAAPGTGSMTDTERLMAIAEIHALKARYFRTMDTKDWAGLEAVFAPDLVADFRDSSPERNEDLLTEGAAKYMAKLIPVLQNLVTVHHGHMPEIEITSETTATGIWAMEDKLWAPEGSPVPFKVLHGFGHYHETYVRLNGQWRIKTIRLTRLHVEAG